MNIPFKLNGKEYIAKFAWTPVRSYSDEFIWLTVYYETVPKPGRARRILSQFDFVMVHIRG